MKSFVSRIWVSKERPALESIAASLEITADMTLEKMVDEFIETFIINQESEKTNMACINFANVYVMMSYVKYNTEEMSVIFAHKDAYTKYVAETMLKLAEALVYVNKTVSDYINQKYS